MLMKNNKKKETHHNEGLMGKTRQRMGDLFTSTQVLGRTQVIGCVAVEVTQRCNLDCTLC